LSYDPRLLFHSIAVCLKQNPAISLGTLSKELQLSRRTIQKAIAVGSGKNFRSLREEFLLARVKSLFLSEPTSGIKAISFTIGYESPRSFARAIRRACGFSPEELRSRAAGELVRAQEDVFSRTNANSSSARINRERNENGRTLTRSAAS
jgi:AraC-like DNA-binding protein